MTPPRLKLLLLPGMEGTGTLFADFVKALPDRFDPIVVDYPTHRFLSYKELLPLAQSYASTSAPFVIVAESFSSPLAIEWAATHPHNLKALVISVGFAKSPARCWLRSIAGYCASLLFVLALPDSAIQFALAGPDAPSSLVAAVRSAISSVKAGVLAARIRAILACDVRPALAQVAVPLLYLQATQDRLVGASSLEEILRIRPEAEVVRVPGPHLILQRQPQLCAAAVSEFIDKLE